MINRARRGRAGETAALAWLESRGLQFIARNFSCRYGELDLIMSEDDILVIVEVRTRRSARFMAPEQSVDRAKQQRIIRATGVFLHHHPRYADNAVRFDVIALDGEQIRWLRDAFGVD